MSPLVSSLWVTLIGMVLIFVSVLLLWGVMDVLMRLTARSAAAENERGSTEGTAEIAESAATSAPSPASDQKKRAAAAAVAVALSLRQPSSRVALPQNPSSAWQAVNRSSQLNHPLHVTRKSRGSA